ncbi:MAG: methyltransferase domain-containing protein [Candidatus Hermodarchaeota archaeon]
MSRKIEKDVEIYYADRAYEYNKTYLRPERQKDIKKLHKLLKKLLSGHRVLEIACGTGYWTKTIAPVSKFITAVDINEEVLQIAKNRGMQSEKVIFIQDDVFLLNKIQNNFSAGFAGFWWSHILKSKLKSFLALFHSKLQPDALVIFFDNRRVEGSSTSISRIDIGGNTYQLRKLEDGREYEILKNFPTKKEILETLGNKVKNLKIKFLKYFWIISYNI